MTTATVSKVDHNIKCDTPGCDKLLALMAARPWKLYCRHCKQITERLN